MFGIMYYYIHSLLYKMILYIHIYLNINEYKKIDIFLKKLRYK